MKKTIEADILKVRQFHTREQETNRNIPEAYVLAADGRGGSYWIQQSATAINAINAVTVDGTTLRASENGTGNTLELAATKPVQLTADPTTNKLTIGIDGWNNWVTAEGVERAVARKIAADVPLVCANTCASAITSAFARNGYESTINGIVAASTATSTTIKSSIMPYIRTSVEGLQTTLEKTVDGLGSLGYVSSATVSAMLDDAFSKHVRLPNGSQAEPAFSFQYDSSLGMYRPAPSILAFSTKGEERLRINAAGAVGIGLKDPVAPLDICGGVYVRGNITMTNPIEICAGQSDITIDDKTGVVHIGSQGASIEKGINSVAIGSATNASHSPNTIAIGTRAGAVNQGAGAIAIGKYAGQTNQQPRSVVINASGFVVNGDNADALYISPMRSTDATPKHIMAYDHGTREVVNVPAFYCHEGRVGVGVAGPQHALDVAGSVNVSGSFLVNGRAVVEELTSTVRGLQAELASLRG
jgi:hypothetical protein